MDKMTIKIRGVEVTCSTAEQVLELIELAEQKDQDQNGPGPGRPKKPFVEELKAKNYRIKALDFLITLKNSPEAGISSGELAKAVGIKSYHGLAGAKGVVDRVIRMHLKMKVESIYRHQRRKNGRPSAYYAESKLTEAIEALENMNLQLSQKISKSRNCEAKPIQSIEVPSTNSTTPEME